MRPKSVIDEARQIGIATELIKLGARLQVLESETSLSRERLLKLYKEIKGESPPKGMLPFSTDWFMAWQPNVHASLFMNVFARLRASGELEEIDALIRASRLYNEQCALLQQEPVLSITRAWRLVKFFNADMLAMAPCCECGGRFVVHAHDPVRGYVCGLCKLPSRAGRTKARAAADADACVE